MMAGHDGSASTATEHEEATRNPKELTQDEGEQEEEYDEQEEEEDDDDEQEEEEEEEEEDDEQEKEAAEAAHVDWLGIVHRARARQRSRFGGAKPLARLEDEDVILILSLERDGDGYLDDQGRRYTSKKFKDILDMILRDYDETEAWQARVMRELCDKGYAETDGYRVDEDDEYIDETNEWTRIQGERHKAASARRRLARVNVAVETNTDSESEDDDD